MGAATLSLGQVKALETQPYTTEELRRRTAALRHFAFIVRGDDWYDLPYDLRCELKKLPGYIDRVRPSPKTFKEKASFVSAGFELLWEWLIGKNAPWRDYYFAMAQFEVNLRLRLDSEASESKEKWAWFQHDDPEISARYERAKSARASGETASFVEVDWRQKNTP